MLRVDGDFIFYKIQLNYKGNEEWYDIGDKFYLKQYQYGEYSACGKCWQKIGENGIFDFEYARQFCNDLNDELEKGNITSKNGEITITGFRIIRCEISQKRTVLSTSRY